MAMSNEAPHVQDTQHAFLVAWGRFAEQIGLVQGIQAVPLHQKRYHHTPQAKVLEFLVATLSGLQQLQQISLAAHPLDKDQAVAAAWGQPAWADYTGVSRTLSTLTWEDAHALVHVLEQVSQPFVDAELQRLRASGQRLRLDGDLTGLPVSNTSRTYPNAAFGHMDDEIRLGYQAALVSMVSPTYGRLWLSITHHPGDTVSCTQAEALVLAAEARTRLRPRRRTDLLRQRIQDREAQVQLVQERLATQQKAVAAAQAHLQQAREQVQERCQVLTHLEQCNQVRKRPERPTGRLAQARQRLQAAQRRCQGREQACQRREERLGKTQTHLTEEHSEIARLQQRLTRFEQDNTANPRPVAAEFRLDAGFGTYDNVALLIEMGYEVYTKAHSHQIARFLASQISADTTWTRVGDNAEMVTWGDMALKGSPYPLDVALERFYTGKTRQSSALLHFGDDSVTADLPAWFTHYNGRQIIEAGIKEGKQVFYLHRIKVRAEPAIYVQEAFVTFAANFIRWATHWLAQQGQSATNALDVSHMGIKRQVQVAAHTSAQVSRHSDGWLLTFGPHSAYAGKVLYLPGRY
jgi:hypothetical protein